MINFEVTYTEPKYKVSQELFEAVMGRKAQLIGLTTNTFEFKFIDLKTRNKEYIYVSEVFFMCKKFAFEENYELRSYHSRIWKDFHCEIIDLEGNVIPFRASSEQQSVFDATQWVLDNKDK